MQKMKKVLPLFLAVVMILSVFTACGQQQTNEEKSTSSAQPATATAEAATAEAAKTEKIILHNIGGPDSNGYEEKMNAEFEKNTGISVVYDSVPYAQRQQKIITSFMAKAGTYDIVKIDSTQIPQYVAKNWIAPVDDHITQDMKDDLWSSAAISVEYNNHWYGMPTNCEFKSFVYNADMLKKAGINNPPVTWDEFVQDSMLLQQKGIVKYATAWSWKQDECLVCDFVALSATFGGEFFDASTTPIFNRKANVDALQFMVDTIYKYKISDPSSLTYSESNVLDEMSAGNIAFQLNWGLPLETLNDAAASKVVGQSTYSLIPSNIDKHVTINGPMCYSIPTNSRYQKEAWDYIYFRVGKDTGAKQAAMEDGNVPGWKSLFSDPDVIKAAGLDLLMPQAELAVDRPMVPWYTEFSNVLQIELQNALTQKKTPQAALDDAVKQTMDVAAKNK